MRDNVRAQCRSEVDTCIAQGVLLTMPQVYAIVQEH